MKNSRRIKRMVGIATLAAITVVLQVISNYIKFGPVNITLALIPMVVGSILYGPLAGFGLGAGTWQELDGGTLRKVPPDAPAATQERMEGSGMESGQ